MLEIIDGRNGGYPCIREVAEKSFYSGSVKPFPEYGTIIYNNVNKGYPSILKLRQNPNINFSMLYYNDNALKELHINSKCSSEAYLKSEQVLSE